MENIIMANRFLEMSDSETWNILSSAIGRAASEQGWALNRVPGRGRANVWELNKDGKKQSASFRTTKDRWFAFPPLNNGTRWKTLDDADLVFVAAVDDRFDPRRVQIYQFPADEVRRRFKEAYTARINAGRKVRDNFGMWVKLDFDNRARLNGAGSGLAEKYKPIAVYDIDTLIDAPQGTEGEEISALGNPFEDVASDAEAPTTIAEVLTQARERVASIAGVKFDAVKLELRIEH
jgi:hypothetical protein